MQCSLIKKALEKAEFATTRANDKLAVFVQELACD
jgi:hypothetical protein